MYLKAKVPPYSNLRSTLLLLLFLYLFTEVTSTNHHLTNLELHILLEGCFVIKMVDVIYRKVFYNEPKDDNKETMRLNVKQYLKQCRWGLLESEEEIGIYIHTYWILVSSNNLEQFQSNYQLRIDFIYFQSPCFPNCIPIIFFRIMSSVDKGFEVFDVSREVQAVTVVDGPASGIFRAEVAGLKKSHL